MSHSIANNNPSHIAYVRVTIINYTTGGETVLSSEVLPGDLSTIDSVIFGTVPPGQNSLGVPLFPVLLGGKVALFQFTAGVPGEIPTTANLNAVVPCLVHLS